MDREASRGKKVRVLFACAGNTCRSLMAEHIARKKFGSQLEASSAGFQPGVTGAQEAIETLRRLVNIDASDHEPRHIRDVDVDGFDYVVAMDSSIARQFKEQFPAYPADRFIKWNIDDPYGDDLAEYDRCAKKIFEKLRRLPFLNEQRQRS
jgi:protein-tyrosine-phosphatase